MFENLPPFTRFHIAIGITAIVFAAMALLLRLPGDVFCIRIPARIQANIIRPLHSLFGFGYVACAIFMPITAIWIWPRLGTPYLVVVYIATMFIAMVFGILAIRIYAWLNSSPLPPAITRQESEKHASVVTPQTDADSSGSGAKEKEELPPVRRHLWLKYLHGALMFYSWVMIVGAGSAFSSNARTGGFPYTPGVVSDSLIGRCYGRDFTDAPKAPSWLSNLSCGYGALCAVSSSGGGANPYAYGHPKLTP